MTSAPINRELAEKGVGALFEEGFKEEAEAINAFLADHAAQAVELKVAALKETTFRDRLDEANGRFDVVYDVLVKEIARAVAAEAQITAQSETIKSLSEALHPFALEAMEWSATVSSDFVPECCEVGAIGSPAKFTIGDLRRAASAYAATLSHDTGEQSQ